jgi:DNA polymerase III delta subunit
MTDTASRKKNIILFTGPNRIFRERELSAWVRAFERKYGADQIVRLDVAGVSADALRSELASSGLFATTKLVILSGWASPQSEDKPTESETAKSDLSSLAGAILTDLAERIPDSTFVVVHAASLDRRSKFSKFLEKNVTVKLYDVPTERDVRAYAETYDLDPDAARLLADRYRDDME